MTPRGLYELPEDKERVNRRAVRLEWWTIAWMASVIAVIYLTMGNSQAMKAAWIEDLLSLVPPIAFLVASRHRSRRPTEDFPYGYHRSITIAFLCAATALTFMGLYIIYDSMMKLVKMEHPTIGLIEIGGLTIWSGWVMIAALVYSAIPPVILGRMKHKPARELHDKALAADADMNKADWLTALAGIVGVLGIGLGWWWLDGIAALFISIEILRDGLKNLSRAVADLMDARPRTIEGEVDPTARKILDRILDLDWIEDATVRLREEGHVFSGEIYIVPKSGTRDLVEKIAALPEIASEVSWVVYDMTVMPLSQIEASEEDSA